MDIRNLFKRKEKIDSREKSGGIDDSVIWCADYGKITDVLYLPVGISKVEDKMAQCTELRAIWDTGSYISCISNSLVKKLGIQVYKQGKLANSFMGSKKVNSYLVNIYIKRGMVFENIEVLGTDMGGNMDVIIGMDIISKGNFYIQNTDGNTMIQYKRL